MVVEDISRCSDSLDQLADASDRGSTAWHERLERVIATLCHVTESRPRNAKAFALLSRALLSSNKADALERARAAAEKAVELNPRAAWASFCLGQVLTKSGNHPAGLAAYQRTCELDSGFVQSHVCVVQSYFSQLKQSQGSTTRLELARATIQAADKALQALENQVNCNSEIAQVAYIKGKTLHREKRFQECLEACKLAVSADHSHQLARYLLQGTAATLGVALEDQVSRAPQAYVKRLYDTYADKFDEHLVDALEYQTPSILARELTKVVAKRARPFESCADLGCGTGLGMRQVVEQGLCKEGGVGVDLSAKMIEKARALGLYSRLDVNDLLPWLEAQQQDGFDLVLSSDVFVYIGDLSEIFTQVSRVLQGGGVFAFSVEAAELESGYHLTPTRRFAHSTRYIKQLCQDTLKFIPLSVTEGVRLRKQAGKPVLGTIFLYCKAGMTE